MKDYIIVSDVSADLTLTQIQQLNLEILPLPFLLNDKQYYHYSDARELPLEDFYKLIKSGANAKTSIGPLSSIKNCFEKYISQDLDILYIALSSGISGLYNSVNLVARELQQSHPSSNISVIDSKCASMGLAMLLYYAAENHNKGMSLTENVQYLENLKYNICHYFTVDDLNQLKKGGRISPTVAFLGSMMNIKPLLYVNNLGKLELYSKIRGRKASIDALFSKLEQASPPLSDQIVYISHGNCEEDAMYLKNIINERYHPKDIVINYVSPIIGSHSGQGTLALFFVGNGRNPNI